MPVAAEVYHYGWVKSPEQMKRKMDNTLVFYSDDDTVVEDFKKRNQVFDFNEFDSIRKFEGEHPFVMKERIASKNWEVVLDVNKKKLSPRMKLLAFIEKLTGIRPFAFSNSKIIRIK